MTFSIKNWKLTLLAFFFICLFTLLGCWQVSRAHEKERLLDTYAQRAKHTPINATALNNTKKDWHFYQTTLTGSFDNGHTFLLDNKTFHSEVGYEIYTPFYAEGSLSSILVDRGFVPLGKTRQVLPIIPPIVGITTVSGLLNFPPAYVSFGKIHDQKEIAWPLRVEFINLGEMSKLLNYPLSSYIINITPKDRAAFAMEWQVVNFPPERHKGYAMLWFALALTLLILFVALNRNPSR